MKIEHLSRLGFVISLTSVLLQGHLLADEVNPGQGAPTFGEVVDPDGDCRIELGKESVLITVPGTHHDLTYTEQYRKHNAPRVLRNVEGDFSLSASIEAFPLPGQDAKSSGGNFVFVSGGQVVWIDVKNYIRFERAAIQEQGVPFIWLEAFKNGQPVVQETKAAPAGKFWLRITRRGDALAFSVSDDGTTWRETNKLNYSVPEKLQVGFVAVNSTTVEHRVQFGDVSFEP
jgi:hypothetical protein